MAARLTHSDLIVSIDSKRDERVLRVVDVSRLDNGARFCVQSRTIEVAVLVVDRMRLFRVLANSDDPLLIEDKSEMAATQIDVIVDNEIASKLNEPVELHSANLTVIREKSSYSYGNRHESIVFVRNLIETNVF